MPQNLPEPVKSVLERLEEERGHKLSIGIIRGKYYVYESVTKKIRDRFRTITLYLGKITENGEFIEPQRRKRADTKEVNSAGELAQKRAQAEPLRDLIYPDSVDLAILQELSTNARISANEIAKKLGIEPTLVNYRIKRLEQRYNIKYTIEIAPRPFNLFRYIVLVKFLNDKPNPDETKEVLEQEPTVLFAASLKGDYDLFIYMFAENTKILDDKIYNIRSSHAFAPYESEWNVTYITYAYGYVPLRDKFFDLLREKVWHRSKETPRKKEGMLTEREYLVLKELNENSRQDFAEIDKKLGLGNGAAYYTYYSLLEKGIILRSTIEIQSLPIKYEILFVCTQTDTFAFNLHRREFLMHLIDLPKTPTSTYALEGDIGAPRGVIFIAPSYSGNLKESEDLLSRFLRGSKMKSNVIVQTLVGSLGYRRIDPKVTYQYPILQEMQQQENQQIQQT